jgi:hypothetical protein
VPLYLITYLRVYYLRSTLEQRRDFVAKVEGCSTLANVYKEVVYPTLTDPPIPYLPVFLNRLRYDWLNDREIAYSYMYRDLRLMQKHYKQEYE